MRASIAKMPRSDVGSVFRQALEQFTEDQGLREPLRPASSVSRGAVAGGSDRSGWKSNAEDYGIGLNVQGPHGANSRLAPGIFSRSGNRL